MQKEIIDSLIKTADNHPVKTTKLGKLGKTELEANRIIELLIEGHPRHLIAYKIMEEFDVNKSQAYVAWKRADEIISNTHANLDMDKVKREVLARYEELYHMAVKKGHEQVASNILKEYAKLAGIDDDKLSNQSITINLQPYEDKV